MEDRSEKITGEQERKSDSAEFLKPAEGDSQLIIKLQCGELFEGTTRKLSRTLLILVCDQSGSMSIYFQNQVVPALLQVVGQSFTLPHVEAEVILYESDATRLSLTPENYKGIISPLRAGGGTSFSAAFQEIQKILNERAADFDEVVVGFLTDGQDGSWKEGGHYEKLRSSIQEMKRKVTVHAIAFTANHDFELLNGLRQNLGNVEGGFQYAEPSDGPDALRAKLEAVFESVSVQPPVVDLVLRIPGYAFVEYSLDGDIVHQEWKNQATLSDGQASVSTLVRQDTSGHFFSVGGDVDVDVEITAPEKEPVKRTVHAQVCELTKGTASEKFKMKQLEMRLAAVTKAIADGATSGKATESDRQKWTKFVKDIQEKLSVYQGVKMLSMFKKSDRAEMFEAIHEFTSKINQLHLLLAEMAKGSMSVAQKARLAELTYGHKFQKATRARRMDERAERNAGEMAKIEENIKALTFDTESLKGFNEDLLDSFRCVLSQMTWADLLQEEEKDVMGFGIAVGRPEISVDDPTQLRIYDVSITTVAKSSFEDAVKFSIDTKGHIQAHGGFELGTEMGVALRGMGREPINTWMPLYINKEHWKLVLAQIKPILGYIVTLDPLGYNANQIDVLFLVLGTIAARLTTPGERQLAIMFQLLRTCIQLLRDIPNLQEKALKNLRAFIESPENRLKDVTKNLLVFMGYLLALPLDKLDTIVGSEEDWELLWLNILAEAVRRSSDSVFRNATEPEVDAFIESIVIGEAGAPLSETEVKEHGFWNKETVVEQEAVAERPEYSSYSSFAYSKGKGDPAADNSAAPVGAGRGAARSRGGFRGGRGGSRGGGAASQPSKPRKKKERLAEIPERDEKMVKYASALSTGDRGDQSAAADDDNETPRYDATAINADILDSLEWFQAKYNVQGHPTISAIISIVCFTRAWIKLQRAAGGLDVLLERLDEHAGVIPEEWVKEIKEGFKSRKSYQASFVSCFDVFEGGSGGGGRVTKCAPLNVVRAMIVQGSKLRVNKDCKEAITESKYFDPVAAGNQLLESLHQQIVARAKAKDKKKTRNEELKYAIQRCLSTESILMFIGYLTSKRGLNGMRNTTAFQELYWQFQNVETSAQIPLGIQKLKILIMGKAEVEIDGVQVVVNVLDNGKAWVPGERKSKKKYRNNVHRFRRIWGVAYDEIVAAAAKEPHLH